MRDRPSHCGAGLAAALLAAALLCFAALPALHGAHGGGDGPTLPAFHETDGIWTAAEADCPLCRGLVRARVAPAPPGGTLDGRVGSLPLVEGDHRVAAGDAPRTQRARAPPALA